MRTVDRRIRSLSPQSRSRPVWLQPNKPSGQDWHSVKGCPYTEWDSSFGGGGSVSDQRPQDFTTTGQVRVDGVPRSVANHVPGARLRPDPVCARVGAISGKRLPFSARQRRSRCRICNRLRFRARQAPFSRRSNPGAPRIPPASAYLRLPAPASANSPSQPPLALYKNSLGHRTELSVATATHIGSRK